MYIISVCSRWFFCQSPCINLMSMEWKYTYWNIRDFLLWNEGFSVGRFASNFNHDNVLFANGHKEHDTRWHTRRNKTRRTSVAFPRHVCYKTDSVLKNDAHADTEASMTILTKIQPVNDRDSIVEKLPRFGFLQCRHPGQCLGSVSQMLSRSHEYTLWRFEAAWMTLCI